MKKIGMIVLLLISIFTFSGYAHAHTLWINLSDYAPHSYGKMGAFTKAYIGWGHRYPVDDFVSMDDLAAYAIIGPDGERQDITPEAGGYMAKNINLKSDGIYYIFAEQKPGFYTMHAKDGRVHHKMGTMEGCSNVILSLYYQQYTKALVTVGKADGEALTKPLGHTLEIVPLQNPANLKTGDQLKVQVLFQGKPARFCQVLATYQGFSSKDDYAFATTANGKGEAMIRILHHGPWLVKAKIKTPPEDDKKDKCLENSYSATLTFAIP